jgi:hypothetical protein
MRSTAVVVIGILLAGAGSAHAGQPSQTAPAATLEGTALRPAQAPAEPGDLPVSVGRIRRKLAQAPTSKAAGLRLEYYVEVYGKSPQIDLFTNFDPKTGPVQYGSPTHQEFLDLVTPEAFKAPTGDLLTPALALMKWLVDKTTDKSSKKPDPPR